MRLFYSTILFTSPAFLLLLGNMVAVGRVVGTDNKRYARWQSGAEEDEAMNRLRRIKGPG